MNNQSDDTLKNIEVEQFSNSKYLEYLLLVDGTYKLTVNVDTHFPFCIKWLIQKDIWNIKENVKYMDKISKMLKMNREAEKEIFSLLLNFSQNP